MRALPQMCARRRAAALLAQHGCLVVGGTSLGYAAQAGFGRVKDRCVSLEEVRLCACRMRRHRVSVLVQ